MMENPYTQWVWIANPDQRHGTNIRRVGTIPIEHETPYCSKDRLLVKDNQKIQLLYCNKGIELHISHKYCIFLSNWLFFAFSTIILLML